MELRNSFTLPVPIDECWNLLTDLERVASCVPGFTPSGWDSDTYMGTIKVKVGAVAITYESRLKIVDKDDGEHRAAIRAEGRERGGQGKVTAMMRSELKEARDRTEVTMVAEVDVTGRVASFGRGILVDVNNRLVERFARNVETTFLQPRSQQEGGAAAANVAPERSIAGATSNQISPATTVHATDEPLDLVSIAAGPALRRLVPVVALGLLIILFRRRSR